MSSAQTRIAVLTFGLCATPYLGLRSYLALGMHETAAVATLPEPWILTGLFFLGVAVPTSGVVWTVRWVLKDGLQFQLAGLLEAYGALILLFASGYAIVQVGSIDPGFTGMPSLWSASAAETARVHVDRLHEVFYESLYLSVITITTVGYGDIAPLTWLGKILTAVEGLAGIGFVGIALGHYFSICLHRREAGDPCGPPES